MNGSAEVFIDTNVLVYLFDEDSPSKRATAQATFDREASSGRIVVSTQVLQEFYVNVTRKLRRPLPEKDALAATRGFAQYPVVRVDTELVLHAIERCQAARISFWDALIVEAALAAGCRLLLSEDLQSGRRFGDLVIENPFAAT